MPLKALAAAFKYHLRLHIKTTQYSKRYTDHFHFSFYWEPFARIENERLSPVHSIDVDAQLSVNIKDTALTQAAFSDVDADADAGIEFISIPASTSASFCEPGFIHKR